MTTDPAPAVRLDATTLARLRLDRDPFAQEACGFIFSDAAHRTQTNIASQMLQHSDRLLLVRGEPGVGKSTFLAGLARRRVPGLALCHVHAEPALALPTLCGRLLEGLGEELPADFDIEGGAFLDRVWELTARGRRPVLLLDDAEQLSPAVLRQLVACWRKGVADGSPFGLVLAGEPRLDEQMAALGVKVPVHVINLYPFSERQTLDYLTQCLQAAGNDGTLLSQAERRQIHIRSQGFAAAINAQAQQLLAAKGSAGKTAGRRPPLLLALGAVTALLAAVAVALPQWKASPQAEQPAVQVADDAPYGLPMPDRYGFRAPGHADPEPAQEQDIPILRAAAQENAGASALERKQAPAAPAEEDPETAETPDSSAPSEIDENGMEVPAAPAPQPEEPEALVEAAARAELPPQAPPSSSELAWLLAQPPGHFTIQLVAAHDRATLERFIASHGLHESTTIIRSAREGRDWYLALSGQYRSTGAAMAAVEALPPALRESGAWVRSFRSVRETLPQP